MTSDWKKGSAYDVAYGEHALVIRDPEQVVLESDPYRRLSYTWHTYTPEWAAAHGVDPEQAAVWGAEPRSKVAFDIEESSPGVVKLTVVHDSSSPGACRRGCGAGLARRAGQPQDAARDRAPLPARLAAGLAPRPVGLARAPAGPGRRIRSLPP